MRDIKKINAILEDDLNSLLKEFNMFDKIKNGEILCYSCKRQIELGHVKSVLIIDSNLNLKCDRDDCETDKITQE